MSGSVSYWTKMHPHWPSASEWMYVVVTIVIVVLLIKYWDEDE
jgi:hypothetical protein